MHCKQFIVKRTGQPVHCLFTGRSGPVIKKKSSGVSYNKILKNSRSTGLSKLQLFCFCFLSQYTNSTYLEIYLNNFDSIFLQYLNKLEIPLVRVFRSRL